MGYFYPKLQSNDINRGRGEGKFVEFWTFPVSKLNRKVGKICESWLEGYVVIMVMANREQWEQGHNLSDKKSHRPRYL